LPILGDVAKYLPYQGDIIVAALFLSANEVAELSGAPKTVIAKAIEHRILSALPADRAARGSRRATLLPSSAVGYAAIVKDLGRRLTLSDKKRVAHAIGNVAAGRISDLRVELAPGLIVTADAAVTASVLRAERYAEGRERYIEINAAVMGGTPVIRGTRITVYAIQGRLDGGDPLADLMEDYPDIPAEAFDAARIYARTHPLVGRPGGRPWDRKPAA
jgi:uncharacterized protein (DUF433 family)